MFKKFLFFLSLVFFFWSAGPASAFGISPLKYVVAINPGGSRVVEVTVKNFSNKSVNYSLVVVGAVQDGEGHPLFSTGVSAAENWVIPEKKTIIIPANSEEKVNFNINVPDGSYPGFYYLGLGVQEKNISGEGVVLTSQLNTLLSLQVAGTANEDLQIEKWLSKQKFYLVSNLDFDLILKNNGNVDLPIQGKVMVKNLFFDGIKTEYLYLGNNLLPSAKRVLQPEFVDILKWPGLYHLDLNVRYGLTGQMAAKSALVWYLPAWSIAVGLLVLVLLAAIVSWLFKLKKKLIV